MRIGIKDVILYTIFGVTIAMVVNHYGELNIPFINALEETLLPSSISGDSDESYDEFDTGGFPEKAGCDRAKTSGDSRVLMHQRLKNAKNAKDWEKVQEIEEAFARMDEREREACE